MFSSQSISLCLQEVFCLYNHSEHDKYGGSYEGKHIKLLLHETWPLAMNGSNINVSLGFF